ncbi:LysE family translocator [Oceanobacillus manasiensis]|uniref:LysE family translocator n=1 Tax=Oceanobacillus manasiensis TaxID=586413 RepID=UPI0005A93085|nr:LysE family translocator [Oceanobacillus manasiensis]
MGHFFSYILLGIALSAPVGPINAAQLNRGIHHGFFHAWLVGLGAMLGDLVFMLLIYFGLASFLTTPLMKTFLWSFGFFILVYTGIESIAKAKKQIEGTNPTKNSTKKKSFGTGFFMAISNPLNIVFWLGIYGAVLAKTSETIGSIQILLYSSGIFIGIIMWDVLMAGLASAFRTILTDRLLYFITVTAGVSLIGFGLYFGYEAMLLLQKL